jgi:hypothetical protein
MPRPYLSRSLAGLVSSSTQAARRRRVTGRLRAANSPVLKAMPQFLPGMWPQPGLPL